MNAKDRAVDIFG